MIGRLRGILVEKQPPELLIDVNGVFYEVHAPMTSIYRLPELNHDVELHTHFVVQETVQQLYGFYERRDRDLFRALIKVNGVGPKLGLAILSGMEGQDVVQCVMDDNVSALVKLPGVGRKTAERLVIDMRDRLKDWPVSSASTATQSPAAGEGAAPRRTGNDVIAEAESALIALGYKPAQAAQMVLSVQGETASDRSEDLIRLALRSLAS